MKEPRTKRQSWRARVHPFNRRWRYRKSRREDEIEDIIQEEDKTLLLVAKLGALIAAGKIQKPKPGETIRVKYKK